MAGVMFVGFFVVGMVAVQRQYALGVDAPRSPALAMGGFLSGAARVLGISSLSKQGLSILYTCTLVVLFAAYIWTLVLLAENGRGIGRAFIIGSSVAFCVWLLFTPPILAKDLFNFASYSKAIAVHGKNPYILPPSAFPRDQVLQYISWKGAVSVYGPLFNYLAALTTVIAGKSVVANVIAFKLLAFAFFVGSLFLLDDLARRTKKDRRSFMLLAAAWNPLVLIHLVGGGHNDTIMVFFILLGFLLYKKERALLAICSVVLAAMIKSTAALVLIPMLVLFVREYAKRSFRQYVMAAVAIVGIPLVLYLPYWPGLSGFRKMLSVGSGFNAISIPSLFRLLFERAFHGLGMSVSLAQRWGRNVASLVFLLLLAVLFIYFCSRVRDYRSLIYYSGAIALAFLFTTSWLMAWYGGFVMILTVVSGSYLLASTGIAATVVFAFYGKGLNPLPFKFFTAMLLLVAICLLLFMALRKRRTVGPSRLVNE
jgi:alpha-1,6-mannosyltransferase